MSVKHEMINWQYVDNYYQFSKYMLIRSEHDGLQFKHGDLNQNLIDYIFPNLCLD